jgi:hypothetical protein
VGQSTGCQQAVIFLSGRVEYRRRLQRRSEFTLASGKTQRAGKDAGATKLSCGSLSGHSWREWREDDGGTHASGIA